MNLLYSSAFRQVARQSGARGRHERTRNRHVDTQLGGFTLGTASIVAPWLGFIIGDRLVRAGTDRARRERR